MRTSILPHPEAENTAGANAEQNGVLMIHGENVTSSLSECTGPTTMSGESRQGVQVRKLYRPRPNVTYSTKPSTNERFRLFVPNDLLVALNPKIRNKKNHCHFSVAGTISS